MFAREGASIVLGDILDDAGKKLEAEIRAAGGRATYVHLDVTREADWQAAVGTAGHAYGQPNGVGNNAGILPRAGGSTRAVHWATLPLAATAGRVPRSRSPPPGA